MKQRGMKDLQSAVNWLLTGETGRSSKAMLAAHFGIEGRTDHPLDPSDLNRCLLLLGEMPELRFSFLDIAKLSPQWGRIIAHWDLLEETFLDEAGLKWCKSNAAPKTYLLMQDLRV